MLMAIGSALADDKTKSKDLSIYAVTDARSSA